MADPATDQPDVDLSTKSDMRTLLICHDDAPLDYDGMTRWLASFSNLVGVVRLKERPEAVSRRIKRELKRIGPLRFVDVLAFRFYYKFRHAKADAQWNNDELARIQKRFPAIDAPSIETHTPNTPEAENFIRETTPDVIIARSKFMLNKRIFKLAKTGTFVMHPGICPEYRNAHGCFWALANDDTEKVGLTLLKIDEGIDTGPNYGYFTYDYDSAGESHIRIQDRCVTENYDELAKKLVAVHKGEAKPIDTTGRSSGTWGQPWMTKYIKWKRKARQAKS